MQWFYFFSGGVCLTPADAENDKVVIYMILINSSFWQNTHFCFVHAYSSVFNWKIGLLGEKKYTFLKALCTLVYNLDWNVSLLYLWASEPHWLLYGPDRAHDIHALAPSFTSFSPWLLPFLPESLLWVCFLPGIILWMVSGTLWRDRWESHEVCLLLAHELLKMILQILFDISECIVPWLKIASFPSVCWRLHRGSS